MKTPDLSSNSHEYVLNVALSDTHVNVAKVRNEKHTFRSFYETFIRKPEVGPKEGSYYLRGPIKAGSNRRLDDNLESACLVILDGDKSSSAGGDSFQEGAPDPKATHEALERLEIAHIVHTTFSHGQPDKGNRFRVLVPSVVTDLGLIRKSAEYLCQKLSEEGVYLANVPENSRLSQPWHFPRIATRDAEYKHYYFGDQPPFQLPNDLEVEETSPPPKKRTNQALAEVPLPHRPHSIAAAYNAMYGSLDQVRDFLIANDYIDSGATRVDCSPARRFRCPSSTTGAPGTLLMTGPDGLARVFSHHGSDQLNEPAGDSGAKDAFNVYRILEHGGNLQDALLGALRLLDPRPLVIHSPGETHRQVEEVCDHLAKLDPPEAFQRANSLVRIVHTPERLDQDGILVPKGTASIHPLKKNTLSLLLSTHLRFGRLSKKGDEWLPSDPFSILIGALLDGVGHWGDIPALRGICEAPILLKDGSVLSDTGFESETGLYVSCGIEVKVRNEVTRQDALEAIEVALSPFEEFPFVESELGRSCVLAYLLTLLLRPLIPTAPLFVVSARAPGTGKGLLVEVANTIVRGSDAAIMPPVRGKDSQEEMRKRITSVIAHGMSSLCIDNCTQPLGGDALNALLTTSEWTDRQLGSNQVIKLPVCVTLAATGNNLGVRGDMVRRAILIELDAQVERPELRSFNDPDLLATVRNRRPELLKALLTILKGYQEANHPESGKNRLGRFEEWSERVCGPIRWLGLPNPVDSQVLLREEDPDFEALRALLEVWYADFKDEWASVKDLIARAEPEVGAIGAPGVALQQALLEIANNRGQIDPRSLGWYLRRNLGRVAANLKLERQDKGGRRNNHGHFYRVVPVNQPEQSVDD